MKTKLNLCFIACLIAFTSHAQVNFEPGIIITKSGQKIECLIENKDWLYNPTSIRYRLNSESEIVSVLPSSIKLFQIGNEVRYVGITTDIDQSSTKELDLDYSSEPIYEKRAIFIKELVSGEAKLYMFKEKSIELYFYSIRESDISPLVHKKYYVRDEKYRSLKRVRSNNEYKNTLFKTLKCTDIELEDVRSLEYKKKSLVPFFTDYNFCKTGSRKIKEDNTNKYVLNLRAKAGLSYSSLEVDQNLGGQLSSSFLSLSMDNEISARFGAELEYVFGFYKNKWAIFIEPSFLSYSSQGQVSRDVSFSQDTASVDYKIIELPIGVRHYMFLNDNSSLFLNIAVLLSVDFSDFIVYENNRDLEINTAPTIFFGFGYEFNHKFSVEARIYAPRETVVGLTEFKAPFNSFGLILGYQFLK